MLFRSDTVLESVFCFISDALVFFHSVEIETELFISLAADVTEYGVPPSAFRLVAGSCADPVIPNPQCGSLPSLTGPFTSYRGLSAEQAIEQVTQQATEQAGIKRENYANSSYASYATSQTYTYL